VNSRRGPVSQPHKQRHSGIRIGGDAVQTTGIGGRTQGASRTGIGGRTQGASRTRIARLDIATTVPFDIQGDTHVLEFELTGTLDGSTFRATGIQDRDRDRRRRVSGVTMTQTGTDQLNEEDRFWGGGWLCEGGFVRHHH
jgi:hypothetical protein